MPRISAYAEWQALSACNAAGSLLPLNSKAFTSVAKLITGQIAGERNRTVTRQSAQSSQERQIFVHCI